MEVTSLLWSCTKFNGRLLLDHSGVVLNGGGVITGIMLQSSSSDVDHSCM